MDKNIAKTLARRRRLLCIGSAAFFSFGLLLDICCWLPDIAPWLPRMGAIISLLGLLFESAYLFRVKEDALVSAFPNVHIAEEKDFDHNWVPFPDFRMHLGFYAIILGTATWAFGDVVSIFFRCSF